MAYNYPYPEIPNYAPSFSDPNVPPGLQALVPLSSIQVDQKVSMIEALLDWERNNKYSIKDPSGQQIYFAVEKSDLLMRLYCGNSRRFNFDILDNTNQPVIKVFRDFKCCAGCCWCAGCCDGCAHEVVVESPPGNAIGYIKQKGSLWKAHYEILDERQDPILSIQGPCCICDGACCPCDNEFNIFSMSGDQVGSITKKYAGLVQEAFTTADSFGITFPMDLSAKTKATLIGALFLIDFMFFEQQNENNDK